MAFLQPYEKYLKLQLIALSIRLQNYTIIERFSN